MCVHRRDRTPVRADVPVMHHHETPVARGLEVLIDRDHPSGEHGPHRRAERCRVVFPGVEVLLDLSRDGAPRRSHAEDGAAAGQRRMARDQALGLGEHERRACFDRATGLDLTAPERGVRVRRDTAARDGRSPRGARARPSALELTEHLEPARELHARRGRPSVELLGPEQEVLPGLLRPRRGPPTAVLLYTVVHDRVGLFRPCHGQRVRHELPVDAA